jgi:hypothetical protein
MEGYAVTAIDELLEILARILVTNFGECSGDPCVCGWTDLHEAVGRVRAELASGEMSDEELKTIFVAEIDCFFPECDAIDGHLDDMTPGLRAVARAVWARGDTTISEEHKSLFHTLKTENEQLRDRIIHLEGLFYTSRRP